ncbi:hypothetical protein ACIPSJ_44140 [Streptomyces sp. NPDC090088]|uniref:hypothetical protein n=1 Tax=Streptomyces sp. NPDC090088 TaxID=3365944 RepID=UPI003801E56F
MPQPRHHAPAGSPQALRPTTTVPQAQALFSDAASATAAPLPRPRELRPPLQTPVWQAPPADAADQEGHDR